MQRREWRRLRFETNIYALMTQTLSFLSWLLVAAVRTLEKSTWRWHTLKSASHNILLRIQCAMETLANAAVAYEEETDTSSGQRGCKRSDHSDSETGLGRDSELEVPEYEQLRQERLRKNELKLQELGIPSLAASLCISTITCTTSAVATTTCTTTRAGGAISLASSQPGLGY